MAMASRMAADSQFSGVYHVTGGGETSWFGFARHIFEISRSMGGPSAEVYPIATADYPTAARRPLNSRLDCSKFARDLGLTLPQWRPASAACIAELLQNPPVPKPFIS
jgi:dTDP-4-dehydrorhamnose reductase